MEKPPTSALGQEKQKKSLEELGPEKAQKVPKDDGNVPEQHGRPSKRAPAVQIWDT